MKKQYEIDKSFEKVWEIGTREIEKGNSVAGLCIREIGLEGIKLEEDFRNFNENAKNNNIDYLVNNLQNKINSFKEVSKHIKYEDKTVDQKVKGIVFNNFSSELNYIAQRN
jgi:hypothetical protein